MSKLSKIVETVAQNRNSIALSTDTGSTLFRDLLCQRDIFTKELRNFINPQEVAVVALKNRPELASIIPALWQLGASVALASPKYTPTETNAILSGLVPRIIITDAPEAFQVNHTESRVLKTEGSPDISILQPISSGVIHPSINRWYPIIKLTSGSTGIPKAVALAEENLLSEFENIQRSLSISDADRIFAPVPLVHSYGFDLGLLMMWCTGATLVSTSGFIPRQAAREIELSTVFLGVPSMYQAFLETRFNQPPNFQKPRFLISCTAPLSPSTIRAFHDKFSAPICQHYGSSEAGATTFHYPDEVITTPHSIGRAMNGVTLRIVDAHGAEAAENTEGEIVVVSGAVAELYLMGAPEGSSPLRGGCYRTGDIGYRDSEGRLFLVGRADQLINVGGLKVSPQEVVDVLETCPEILEAAVKGIADAAGNIVVCAFIASRSPISESTVIDYCKTRLAEYKIPRRVRFLERLPRTPNGKVLVSRLELM